MIAWFAILFTGRYPRALFNYTVGVGRWALRVQAYALGLARMGADVAITGRDRGRPRTQAREIRTAADGQVDVFVADLSSQSEVRRLPDEVLQSLTGSMCWINNVGVTGTPGTSPLTGSS